MLGPSVRRGRLIAAAIICVLGGAAACGAAGATTVTLPVARDCSIQPGAAAPICGAVALQVGATQQKVQLCTDTCQWVTSTYPTRALLQFDTASIPAGVDVLSATLNVNATSKGSGTKAVEVHPSLLPWTDAATWYRWDAIDTPWSANGGDFGPLTTSRVVTATGPNTFDLLGPVREWVAGVRANYGIELVRTGDLDLLTANVVALESKEAATAANRPTLSVTYDPGTPPAVTLGGELYADRDVSATDVNDSGLVYANETFSVSATEGAAGKGVASVEVLVDGTRLRSEHLYTTACTSTSCPASASHTFTMYRNDVSAGDHVISVVVRDRTAPATGTFPGAHISVRRFGVHFDAPESLPRDQIPNGTTFAAAGAPGADPLKMSNLATFVAGRAATRGDALATLLGGGYAMTAVGDVAQVAGTQRQVVGAYAEVTLQQPLRDVDVTVPCSLQRPDGTWQRYRARLHGALLRDVVVRTDPARGEVLCVLPGPESAADVAPVPGQGVALPTAHD